MVNEVGRSPDGSGSRASHRADKSSRPEASIPSADHLPTPFTYAHRYPSPWGPSVWHFGTNAREINGSKPNAFTRLYSEEQVREIIASAIEAATAGETQSGSTEGESAPAESGVAQ